MNNDNESEEIEARLKRFKIWFIGIVLFCVAVIGGAAIFYSQLKA